MMETKNKIQECKSEATLIVDSELLQHISDFHNGKAVAWYYDKIVFYKINNKKWMPSNFEGLESLVRLRLFNENEEIHVWRSNDSLTGRKRIDKEGKGTEFIETLPLLNGTTFSETGNGIAATEDKGIRYELPYSELVPLNGTQNRIGLRVRNYIGYSEDIRQAGIIDSRFIDFIIIGTPKK